MNSSLVEGAMEAKNDHKCQNKVLLKSRKKGIIKTKEEGQKQKMQNQNKRKIRRPEYD